MAIRFKGKRFTIMGLDPNGRGLQDALYLLQHGAEVIGTDLKKENELPEASLLAEEFPNFTPVFGEHRIEDFKDRDYIIRAALAPLDSPYLKNAKENAIPVLSDETLFLLNAPKITTIGTTGTRGKTTVTYMIYEILKMAGRRAYLGGNVQGTALLPLLDKIDEGDFVVMELDSWKLQSFAENKISPNIAVLTTFFPDHMNYYKDDLRRYMEDKVSIFKNQLAGDVVIISKQVEEVFKDQFSDLLPQRYIVAQDLPEEVNLKIIGAHNRLNASLAAEAVRTLAIDGEIIYRALSSFPGVPGRLELIAEKNGIRYYNDTTATSPEGAIAALDSLRDFGGKIVWIGGGTDKRFPTYDGLRTKVSSLAKAAILFEGDATDRIKNGLMVNEILQSVTTVKSMSEAVTMAESVATSGDVILLSPGAASFGIFKSEYDRGDQFVVLVQSAIDEQ